MAEDDSYRSSTQFRLWSFTPAALDSLRASTNALAAERVRAAVKRAGAIQQGATGASNGSKPAEVEIDCLTPSEERKLVTFYCKQTMDLADFCSFATSVKATAVQYLSRFYLSQSPMTYHPKAIMPCALFLATKTENHYTSLKTFASKVPKTSPEDIAAAEVLVAQALRFCFDVRHPFRGLEGGIMELLALADGKGCGSHPGEEHDAKRLQHEMLCLPPRQAWTPASSLSPPAQLSAANASTPDQLRSRIQKTHTLTSALLKVAPLLTDAYFHFSPSQIFLACLLLVDSPLLHFFLRVKLPSSAHLPLKTKLLAALETLVGTLHAYMQAPTESQMDELKAIDRKLYKCRNPERVDLVGLDRQKKTHGDAEGVGDERQKKKRRLERERSERDGEVFGGVL